MKLSSWLLEKYRRQTLVTVILMSLWLFFIAASPRTFLDARIYRSFMSTIPVTTILALGMTFLIVAGEMDMSFPSVSAVSALVFAWLHSPDGGNLPAWFSMLCALTAGGMMGAFNGLLVVRMGIPSIIATIGTQFFWRGAALLLSGGKAIPLSAVRDESLHRLFVGRTGPWEIPAQSLWALGLAVFLGLMFNRHRYGEAVLFVGDKSSTAEMNLRCEDERVAFRLHGLFVRLRRVAVNARDEQLVAHPGGWVYAAGLCLRLCRRDLGPWRGGNALRFLCGIHHHWGHRGGDHQYRHGWALDPLGSWPGDHPVHGYLLHLAQRTEACHRLEPWMRAIPTTWFRRPASML